MVSSSGPRRSRGYAEKHEFESRCHANNSYPGDNWIRWRLRTLILATEFDNLSVLLTRIDGL